MAVLIENWEVFEAAWTGDAYEHYLQYGSAEGVNPSDSFDESSYLADKLAALQAADADTYGDWTVADVAAAFADAGLTAVGHFEAYGEGEGLAATAAPAGEAVGAQTFTLVAGTETVTGGTGADTIDGVTSALTSARTLDTTDVIDGGAGTDTLNVTVNSAFTGFTTAGSMANVENVNLTNSSSVSRNFDATGITGVEEYSIDATTGAMTISDLAAVADVSLSNQASGSFSTAMDSTFTALAGTTDAMTFTLDSVGTAAVAASTGVTAVAEAVVTATLDEIETVTIAATGTNVVGFGGNDMTSLSITGAGDVKVTAINALVTSFDASEATGDIVADVTGATALTTVATGAGDDTLTIGSADVLANGEISGGAGDDTLAYSNTGTTVQYSMSGFETIAVGTLGAAMTFSATNVSDLTTVDVSDLAGFGASFVNMGAADLIVNASGDNAANLTLTTNNTGATTLNYTADAATIASISAATASVAGDADTTTNDFTFTGTTGLTVNVGEYYATTGSVITAAAATSLELNVASGKDGATTAVERTKFDSAITAAKATSFVANIEGEITATGAITLAVATSASIVNSTTAGAMDLQAAALETFTLVSGDAFDMSGSDLSAVQTADITVSNDAFTMTTGLDAISTLSIAGTGVSATVGLSSATLTTLGGDNAYNMDVTASGLKGGFTATTIDTGAGYDITLEASGVTGATSITDICREAI